MRFLKTLIIFTLLISINPFTAKADAEQPAVFGEYGIVIEASSGTILYEKNAHEKAYPASITKILTALLLSENIEKNKILKTSEFASKQEASNTVKEGDEISREDALMALIIKSANDVATVIAEEISGSQEEFALLMNERVRSLGLDDTNFTNPNGLPDQKHITTAYDMAMITREAIKSDEVIEAMGTREYVGKINNKKVTFVSKNDIGKQPNVIGGKTGYTMASQNTLVEVFEKDGIKLIGVIMKTSLDREYKDLNEMAAFAFDQIERKAVVGLMDVVDTKNLGSKSISLLATKEGYAYKKNEEDPLYETEVLFSEEEAFSKGDIVGSLLIKQGGEVVDEVPLSSDSAYGGNVKDDHSKSNNEFSWLWFLLLPILGYCLLNLYVNVREKKERNQL